MVLWNDRLTDGLYFLDSIIFVECKNTIKSTSTRDVGWFVDKLATKAQRFGILVSLAGVSGKPGGHKYSHGIIVDYMKSRGIRLLTMNKDEIISANSPSDYVDTIKRKLLSLTLKEMSA